MNSLTIFFIFISAVVLFLNLIVTPNKEIHPFEAGTIHKLNPSKGTNDLM